MITLNWAYPRHLCPDRGPRPAQPAKVWKLPLVELILGLIIVTIGAKTDVNGNGSTARTLVLLAICGVVALYGFFRDPYAPFYVFAFAAPISKIYGTGFALVLGALAMVILRNDVCQWKWRFSRPGLFYCGWTLLSLFWAEHVFTELDSYLAQAVAPMVLAVLISGLRDATFRRNLILMVIFACAIGSVFSFRNWSHGIGEQGSGGRIYSLIAPDPFSAWEVFAILGALSWLIAGKPPVWLRATLIALLPLLMLGLGLCGFRAAILAVVLGFIVVSICLKRFVQGMGLGVVAAVPVIAVAIMVPSIFGTLTGRFKTIGEDRGSERLDIWQGAIRIFRDHPVTGIGVDNFKAVISRYYGQEIMPHSVYIGAAVETGIIGFVLLLAWFWVMSRKAWRSPQRIWIFPLLIAYLFQSAFLHEFYYSCFWLAIGLAEGAPEPDATPARDAAKVLPLPATRRRFRRRRQSFQPLPSNGNL